LNIGLEGIHGVLMRMVLNIGLEGIHGVSLGENMDGLELSQVCIKMEVEISTIWELNRDVLMPYQPDSISLQFSLTHAALMV